MNTWMRRLLVPAGMALMAVMFLTSLYMTVFSLAQSPADAVRLFWENKMMLLPIALGFGLQVGMFTAMRRGLHRPMPVPAGGAATGATGGMSGIAMVACCAPALTNAAPLLALTPLTAFLVNWQTPLLVAGAAANVIGNGFMIYFLLKARGLRLPRLALLGER